MAQQESYILALDQGTSSSRAILYNLKMEVVGIQSEDVKLYYPQPGFVEQDAKELYTTQIACAVKLLDCLKITPRQICSIGITNQRETTIIWNKHTGEPIANALVWQDSRTSEFCSQIKKQGKEELVRSKTGLVIDSYFSASKINWLLNNVTGAKENAREGNLLFGTVDTWLLWKLTGGKVFATDYSNASRTLLYDIHKLKWDEELLEIFEISNVLLPEVRNSSDEFGYTQKEIFGEEIPINALIGDQQAALFGQKCFNPGDAKNTYGTGCFMLMNTGNRVVESKNGLLSTIGWGINNKITYALEGSVFIAGAVIQWLRDNLGIITSASETSDMALSVPDTQGVYFIPAFTGLGAPYWDMFARGTITGLTRGANKNHIVRAALESLAYRTKDVLDAMVIDSGIDINLLKVDGGASVNEFLMQFQSDLLGKEVIRPQSFETTALGAALMAGLASGYWKMEDISLQPEGDFDYQPKIDAEERNILYKGWKKTISKIIE